AAAILALFDRPWSRRELLAILRESGDHVTTSECRAALRECHDAGAHLGVESWEKENPRAPDPGAWITKRGMVLRNSPRWIRRRMERFHDRVMMNRHRLTDPPILAAT